MERFYTIEVDGFLLHVVKGLSHYSNDKRNFIIGIQVHSFENFLAITIKINNVPKLELMRRILEPPFPFWFADTPIAFDDIKEISIEKY